MNILKYKGKRIRASDKNLVYRFCAGTLLLLFVAVLLLLNMGQLMRTDWEHFSLLDNGLTLSTYNFITILIATGVCALVAFLYYRFRYDSFKKLLHRQKLARMILDNKWYEAQTVQDSGFFTDLQGRSREKIVWFPKIYYQMETGLLHIRCEISLGKYQDQLLRLEDKLESGLYCELTDKTLHDGYTVTVHVDADGDMVIIQNPTLAPAMEKSSYEPKADNSVNADTVNDATAFLETFFKLYPTATDKELAYYVEGNALEPINGDYLFSELVNPVFTVDGENVKVSVAVKFIDNQTKATQISQYELTLHKDSNWKIVK